MICSRILRQRQLTSCCFVSQLVDVAGIEAVAEVIKLARRQLGVACRSTKGAGMAHGICRCNAKTSLQRLRLAQAVRMICVIRAGASCSSAPTFARA